MELRTSGSRLPKATVSSSFSSETLFFRSSGLRVDHLLLREADGVDDDEVRLGLRVGRDGLEFGFA